MINYSDNIQNITEEQLSGFFIDWPNPPSPAEHLSILEKSSHRFIAIDDQNENVIGYITALSDNVLFAYIPLLEVLPEYQNHGVGKTLVKLMTDKLKNLYSIDLCCDQNLSNYYRKLGFKELVGMVKRS